jgi:hypothetical protein
MSDLPTGIVAFLFTDLEGSTRLWQEHPETMRSALVRHDELLRDAIEDRGGYVVKTMVMGSMQLLLRRSTRRSRLSWRCRDLRRHGLSNRQAFLGEAERLQGLSPL